MIYTCEELGRSTRRAHVDVWVDCGGGVGSRERSERGWRRISIGQHELREVGESFSADWNFIRIHVGVVKQMHMLVCLVSSRWVSVGCSWGNRVATVTIGDVMW